MAERGCRADDPDLGVVLREGLAHIVIGPLEEDADVIGYAAGIEQADRVDEQVIILSEIRRDTALGNILLSGTQLRLDPAREMDLGRNAGAARLRIALDLEVAPIRRQLRAQRADMAHLTRLARLRGEGRHGLGRLQRTSGERDP